MSRNEPINWVQFFEERKQFRESVKKTKALNKSGKREREGEGLDLAANLGKKRCLAKKEDVFPDFLKFNIKIEGLGDGKGCAMASRQGFDGKSREKHWPL